MQLEGQSKGQPSRQQPPSDTKTTQPQGGQRGTKDSPVFVDIEQHPKSQVDAAKDEEQNKRKELYDQLTAWSAAAAAIFTALLVIVGYRGVRAAVRTLKAIERQADLMEQQATDARESTAQQGRDVQASIAEATRASKAMEGIAESMALNVESVQHSVAISREIANTQKLAIEVQSRPYLSVFFRHAFYQDDNHVFEAEAVIQNHGNTPAYDVVFKSATQIVPVPLPDDFSFPLPEGTAGGSASLLAPGTTKLFARAVNGRVPDDQVMSIRRGGPPRCLAMWGIINYRDAFGKTRYTKFAFTLFWRSWVPGMEKDEHGNLKPEEIRSQDTAHHNEAD